ncbi:MAG: AAA family ATPase [Vicinamibacterales bacterium]
MSTSTPEPTPGETRTVAEVHQVVAQTLAAGTAAICVTGPTGSGKTALCRALAREPDARSFVTVLTGAQLDTDALLGHMLSDFGLSTGSAPPAAHQRETLVTILVRFLSSLKSLRAHAVVVVDDADRASTELLSTLLRVAHGVGHDGTPLRLVLVGQPALEARLRVPPLDAFPPAETTWSRLGFVVNASPTDTSLMESPYADPVEGKAVPLAARRPDSRLVAAAALLVALIGGGWWWLVRSTPSAAQPAAAPSSSQSEANRPPSSAASPERAPSPAPAATPDAFSPSSTATAGRTDTDGSSSSGPAGGTGESYRITVASFRTATRAQQVAAELQARELPVTMRTDATNTWHQLMAGPFPSIEAAREAQRRFESAGFPDTQISLAPAAALR